MIPYGRQTVDDDDVQAVVEVLKSAWLTTGPNVELFERSVANAAGSKHAVAVSNGTAALHCAMHALRVGPGDEVIVPAITFVATANAAVFEGATPVFADVEADTGVQADTGFEPDTAPDAEADTAPDAEADAEADTEADTEGDTEADTGLPEDPTADLEDPAAVLDNVAVGRPAGDFGWTVTGKSWVAGGAPSAVAVTVML